MILFDVEADKQGCLTSWFSTKAFLSAVLGKAIVPTFFFLVCKAAVTAV